MQVYSQTSTSTTLPRSPSAVSGPELTQRSALSVGNLLAAPTRLEPTTMPATSSRKMALMKGHSRIETPAVKGRPPRRQPSRTPAGQVVADAAGQVPVHVPARELRGI